MKQFHINDVVCVTCSAYDADDQIGVVCEEPAAKTSPLYTKLYSVRMQGVYGNEANLACYAEEMIKIGEL